MGSMLYQTDVHAWAIAQAEALRDAGRRDLSIVIDWENVAKEIESLGREQEHALESHLARILEHLLKLRYSPAIEPRRHWVYEVGLHRLEFERRLENNPGLKSRLDSMLADAYRYAVRHAVISLKRDFSVLPSFPKECPFSLEQARDGDWFPEPPRET